MPPKQQDNKSRTQVAKRHITQIHYEISENSNVSESNFAASPMSQQRLDPNSAVYASHQVIVVATNLISPGSPKALAVVGAPAATMSV